KDYQDWDKKITYDGLPSFLNIGENSNTVSHNLLIGAGVPTSFFNNINPWGTQTGLGRYNSVIAGFHFGVPVTYNYDSNGHISGGNFGNIELSPGFAKKLEEAHQSSSSGNSGGGSSDCSWWGACTFK
ncbi:MAG: hypothetical protein FD178_3689, partial [Ignavibacteria bacterium]